jgi:hypothetical protein
MAGSAQIPVGAATALLLAAAPPGITPGQIGWAYISVPAGGGSLWLGGPGVTSTNGANVPAGNNLPMPLFSGDQIFGVSSTGTVTVGVLQTGL